MKKRILSILLLCCMVLTMLPTAAFAAGGAARPAAKSERDQFGISCMGSHIRNNSNP